ncbi:hypothetical protein ACP0FZ_30875, partial [Escherichia coli]|uniref:hypothetical protein n=1 Tax=Escherichia coli TaxID=562 RepID=UPI003CFAE14A
PGQHSFLPASIFSVILFLHTEKKPTLWAGITDNRTVSVEINDVTHYTRWIHKPSLQMHWHPNQRLKQLQWPVGGFRWALFG